MGIKTNVAEWIKFIEEPLPGFDSYPDQVNIVVQGVLKEEGAFDLRSFHLLNPDEPIILKGGVVFVDGHGIDLMDHFNSWRRETGIPTTTFVTFELPDDKMDAFMALVREHGYGNMIADDTSGEFSQECNVPAP